MNKRRRGLAANAFAQLRGDGTCHFERPGVMAEDACIHAHVHDEGPLVVVEAASSTLLALRYRGTASGPCRYVLHTPGHYLKLSPCSQIHIPLRPSLATPPNAEPQEHPLAHAQSASPGTPRHSHQSAPRDLSSDADVAATGRQQAATGQQQAATGQQQAMPRKRSMVQPIAKEQEQVQQENSQMGEIDQNKRNTRTNVRRKGKLGSLSMLKEHMGIHEEEF